jgi:hypothetical protein
MEFYRFDFLEPYKLGIALFVIKPDLVANGKKDEIFNHVNNQNKLKFNSIFNIDSYGIKDLLFI